ncbi:GNAT family N-acetyltransferase [Anaerobacillus sp. CMMVII]|uniref:GNAT family N-acetyltransferase n=1 Tax=Anaerobacillus sp. CMMVII TaxID=2755588 RepID=UPI0021B802FC|nr:GNAT family N-acetyltransferase [Anaerobacillus sp. CMMVII]MCT8137931.1 GNAT family N-acetyltransferase [Anaerobacillus sp. CMMVII]
MVDKTAMKVKIVEYDTRLAGKVADMWNNSLEGWGGERTVMTEEHVRTQEENSTNKHLYIALDGDKAVGYCGLSEYRDDEGALYIPLLNVRDDYHGKKIGKALVLQALQRSIELKWPRLDLYTWAGNTKAVPLYKKCGFFWEERDDTVHLMNFMPTVLNTEAFREFFQKADWYDSSSRLIEVKPDGIKENGFDFFEYRWQHENHFLRVQFEKTGRGMRLIETDEYCIYATISKPALVVGQSYEINYRVKNKTEKPIEITLTGRDDKNIRFSFHGHFSVTKEQEVTAQFFVDTIDEEQNNFRTHPAVTTKVTINGENIEMKLGIEPKLPVKISAKVPANQCFLQKQASFFIEMENNFEEEVCVSFQLPKASFITMQTTSLNITIDQKARKLVEIPYVLESFGYYSEKILVTCKRSNGETVTYEKQLGIAFPGIGTSFTGECEDYWHLYCGRYHVALQKSGNAIICEKGMKNAGLITLSYPKLGKPFSEEFAKLKPTVSFQKAHGFLLMKASFQSQDFSGLLLHSVIKLYMDGLVEHYFEIENNVSGVEFPNLAIYDQVVYEFNNSTFSYQGKIMKLNGKYPARFSLWNSRHVTENWLFSKNASCYGLSWHPDMKLNFANWCLYFEHLFASRNGETLISRSKFINLGVFSSWQEQRAFALQQGYEDSEITYDHLELVSNNGNPFTDLNTTNVKVDNHKQSFFEGTVGVKKSATEKLAEKKVNYEEEIAVLHFENIPLEKQKIEMIEAHGELNGQYIDLKTVAIQKSCVEVIKTVTEVTGNQRLYVVNNGLIEVRCQPSFYPGIFSLKYGEHEWLDSSYPTLAPKAWWNPWSGGIRTSFEKFRPDSLLKEERDAQFVALTDQHQNRWEGIKITVTVQKHQEYKGFTYHQYILLQPGTPVVCYFVEIEQHTNRYFHFRQMFHSLSLNITDGKVLTVTNAKEKQMFTASSEEIYLEGVKQIAFMPKGSKNLLQIVPELDFDDIELYMNQTVTDVSVMKKIHLASGTTWRSKPTFLLFHSEVIDDQALKSLRTLRF